MAQLKLPASISTKKDLIETLRNTEVVLDAYIENGVRSYEGVDFKSRPDVSSNLAELITENKLEVSIENLKFVKTWLNQLKDHAPVVRFTFSGDPSKAFVQQIVLWLRKETGKFVLIRYGIQPSIAAGCLMYTPAGRYDFSLRHELLQGGKIFSNILKRVADEQHKPVPTEINPGVKL